MHWRQPIQLVAWTIFSVCISVVFSIIGLIFMMVRTMDLHKNTSAPGDFAQVAPSAILMDILVNGGIVSIFICFIAWSGYEMTKTLLHEFSSSPYRRQVSKFLYGLLLFNILILCASPIYGSITHWLQRAPYFLK